MSISELMGKLHHKDEEKPSLEGLQVPKPPGKVEAQLKSAPDQPMAPTQPDEPKPEEQEAFDKKAGETLQSATPPKRRWGYKPREVNVMDDDGIVLDIGDGMSINVPIKRRMSLEDFLRIAERVRRIEELDADHASYNEGMKEYQ